MRDNVPSSNHAKRRAARCGRNGHGELDFRGTPVGFASTALRFDLDALHASEETLLKLTERYRVVLQTLRSAPSLTAELARATTNGARGSAGG